MSRVLNDNGHIALHGILFPNLTLAIQGYTDDTGGQAANQTLSEQRAAAVKAALVTRGIAAERLRTIGGWRS
ncbi:MAG: OmpA family protein [Terriglobales bacterium]